MFKKEYQGGLHVEVFSAQGRDPVAKWKLLGPVKREYDRHMKGYVYSMEGGSSTTTRMQLPRNEKAQLGLVQPYCVFQLLVPSDARFTIDLSVVDGGGSKRRIQLSTSLREPSISPLNARVPLTTMLTGQWLNLCVDMESLVSGLFRGQVFKSLEGVSLGGHCMVRRIFTLRASPPDTVSGQTGVEEIPKVYQMQVAAGVIQTQVLTHASVSGVQTPSHSTPEHTSPPSSRATDPRPTHVAFGSKVTIPDHILHCRQSSRSGSSASSETAARGKSGGGVASSRSLQMVDTRQSSAERREAGTVDGQGIQPRPPNHPADPSMLKIQRKRVRMISSGGRRREDGEHRGTERSHQSEVVDSGSSQSVDSLAPGSERVTTMDMSDSDSGYRTSEQQVQKKQHPGEVSSGDVRLMTAVADTSLVMEEEKDEEEEEEEEEEEDEEEEEEEASGYLDMSAESPHAVAQGMNSSVLSSEGSVDLTTSEEDALYLYHSPPKSAGSRHANLTSPVESTSSRRGARLDEDFVSPIANEPGEEGSPHIGVGVVSDMHQLTETRLSDDYDWRQYASVDGDDLAHDRSLHSRLTNPTHTLPLPTTTATTHSNSSEMESTLSGSMTLSGWTERFKDAARGPLLDSLDTREMGGTLSPAMGTLTDQSDLDMEGEEEEEEVELVYDPQLNCFYDPHTCKYYELVQ